MSKPIRHPDAGVLRALARRSTAQSNTVEPLPRAARVDDGWDGLRKSRRLLPTTLTSPAEEALNSSVSLDSDAIGRRVEQERQRGLALATDIINLARDDARRIRQAPHHEVTSQLENGTVTFAREHRDAQGALQRRVRAGTSVAKGVTHSILERVERHEEGEGWVRTHREGTLLADGGFAVRESRSYYPGKEAPDEKAWMCVPEEGAIVLEGSRNGLRRVEETTDAGVHHRAEIRFEQKAPGDVKLPRELREVLASDKPVWEETLERVTTPAERKRRNQVRTRVTTWHQGATRVHLKKVQKAEAYRVEQQVGPHTLRTTSIRPGASEAVRTETERLADGSERETREVWSSPGGLIAGWRTAPATRTASQLIHRWYDPQGILSRQEVVSLDTPDAEARQSVYARTHDGEHEVHSFDLEIVIDGQLQRAHLSQSIGYKDGKPVLKELVLKDQDDMLRVAEKDGEYRILHRNTETGEQLNQTVQVKEGKDSVTLEIGGHSLEIGLAGGLQGYQAFTALEDQDLDGLPLLQTPPAHHRPTLETILPEIEYIEDLSAPARASLEFLGTASSKVIGPLAVLGAFRDGYKAIKEAASGNDYTAALYSAKATAGTGKIVFPWIELPFHLAPILGFAGATADLALGIHGFRHAENGYARLGGASKLGTCSLAFAALAGMPEIPLLTSVLLLEGVGAFAAYKDRNFIPPLPRNDDWFLETKPSEQHDG